MPIWIESIWMGTGIAFWGLVLIAATAIFAIKTLDWIEEGLEFLLGRPDRAIRFHLWRCSLTGEGVSESQIKAAKKVSKWESIEDELEPIIESYRTDD